MRSSDGEGAIDQKRCSLPCAEWRVGGPEKENDFAVNVHFPDRDESLWFAPDLVEVIDHGAGTEITLDHHRLQFLPQPALPEVPERGGAGADLPALPWQKPHPAHRRTAS